METIGQNKAFWGSHYDWSQAGEEWSEPWGGTRNLWEYVILPRIGRYLPAQRIVEIAPGFGRWTQFLQRHCEHLIAVDLASRCVEACQRRFADSPHVEAIQNDGKTIPVADGSVDFVFSFDSLVHVDLDVLQAYLAEIARVLTPSGAAFIHHSNLAMYKGLLEVTKKLPLLARRLGRRLYVLPRQQLRSETVSAGILASTSRRYGLFPIKQELVNWNNGPFLIDSFTTIARSPTPRCEILRNRGFMNEAKRIRLSHVSES